MAECDAHNGGSCPTPTGVGHIYFSILTTQAGAGSTYSAWQAQQPHRQTLQLQLWASLAALEGRLLGDQGQAAEYRENLTRLEILPNYNRFFFYNLDDTTSTQSWYTQRR